MPGDDLDELRGWLEDRIRVYRRTLQPDRRHLLESYRLVDFARKVVGVGSVGTRCWIALMLGRDDADPLFLQVKEAEASVLEAHAGRSGFANHGQRVVEGQRLLQAASDIMLGWMRTPGRRRRRARLLPAPALGREVLGRHRRDDAVGARHLRPPVRVDARPRSRPIRRPGRHRRVPGHQRRVRQGDGRRSAPRTPTRTSATTTPCRRRSPPACQADRPSTRRNLCTSSVPASSSSSLSSASSPTSGPRSSVAATRRPDHSTDE